jgi:O-acetyl-ADP-ribose deacetylase (regulator of RNase III)
MKIIKKDITEVDRGLVVHGVNCQGVMGSGVALAIKNKWPNIYEEFKSYGKGEHLLGISHIIRIPERNDLYVANCYTQVNYGRDGKRYASPEAIRKALDGVFFFAKHYGLHIHSPQIGCGLGGLNWDNEVKPIYESLMERYDNHYVTIYYL